MRAHWYAMGVGLLALGTACSSSSATDAGVDVVTTTPHDTGTTKETSTGKPDVAHVTVDAGHDATMVVDAGHDAPGTADVVTEGAHHEAAPGDAHDEDAKAEGGRDAGGDASDGGTVIPLVTTPTNIKFGSGGLVPCGTSPASKTFTVQNEGTTLLSWWTEFGMGAGSPFSLSTECTMVSPCTLAADKAVSVTVTAPAIPANAGIETIADTVTVFSSAPGDPGTTVSLTETSSGAILAFDPTTEPYGKEPLNSTNDETVMITNTGNANYRGKLVVTGSSEFTTSPASVNVTATTGTSFTLVFKPGTSIVAVTAQVALVGNADGGTCAPLPAPLTASGQGE